MQYVADLSDDLMIEKYNELIREATLIFIDATHDGDIKAKILKNLKNSLTFDYISIDRLRPARR